MEMTFDGLVFKGQFLAFVSRIGSVLITGTILKIKFQLFIELKNTCK